MKKLLKKIYFFFYKKSLKKLVKFDKNVIINKNVLFEGNNYVGCDTTIYNTYFGYSSYTGKDSNISNSYIGKFCSIGPNIRVVIGEHPLDFATTHPCFYLPSAKQKIKTIFTEETLFNDTKEMEYLGKKYSVIIENDVWIGANVTILEGVKIGNGAIIGANSLVTKDIPPYAIAYGTPAKVVKYRFDANTIKRLQELKWWDYPIERFYKLSKYVDNVDLFIEKCLEIEQDEQKSI